MTSQIENGKKEGPNGSADTVKVHSTVMKDGAFGISDAFVEVRPQALFN